MMIRVRSPHNRRIYSVPPATAAALSASGTPDAQGVRRLWEIVDERKAADNVVSAPTASSQSGKRASASRNAPVDDPPSRRPAPRDADREALKAFIAARLEYFRAFDTFPPYDHGAAWMREQVRAEKRGVLPDPERTEVEWRDAQERMPAEAAFYKSYSDGTPADFETLVEITTPISVKQQPRGDALTGPDAEAARDLLGGEIRWTREQALRSLVPAAKQLAYRGAGRKPDYSYTADTRLDDRHALLQRHLPAIERGDLSLSAIKGMLGLSSTSKVVALQRHYAFLSALASEPFPAILLATRGPRGVVTRELTSEQVDLWVAIVRNLVAAVDIVLPAAVAEMEQGAISADQIARLPLPATPCRHDPILMNLTLARAGYSAARAAEGALEQIVELVMQGSGV